MLYDYYIHVIIGFCIRPRLIIHLFPVPLRTNRPWGRVIIIITRLISHKLSEIHAWHCSRCTIPYNGYRLLSIELAFSQETPLHTEKGTLRWRTSLYPTWTIATPCMCVCGLVTWHLISQDAVPKNACGRMTGNNYTTSDGLRVKFSVLLLASYSICFNQLCILNVTFFTFA